MLLAVLCSATFIFSFCCFGIFCICNFVFVLKLADGVVRDWHRAPQMLLCSPLLCVKINDHDATQCILINCHDKPNYYAAATASNTFSIWDSGGHQLGKAKIVLTRVQFSYSVVSDPEFPLNFSLQILSNHMFALLWPGEKWNGVVAG